MADFVLRALIAGLAVAVVAGPLGCFVVWRRMAYFGETLAHSALLGIGLGLLLNIDLQLAVVSACVLLALVLSLMQTGRNLGADTLLGILAPGSLALGLVVLGFGDAQVDLMAYLFGDLLTVSRRDLWWITGCSAAALVLVAVLWNRLLAATLHEELAQVEGLNVQGLRMALMMLIALVVAVSMKVIGVLLITALLIIPAATARRLSRTPEGMALGGSAIGCLAVTGGMAASFFWDTPTGPSIVVVAVVFFMLGSLFSSRS